MLPQLRFRHHNLLFSLNYCKVLVHLLRLSKLPFLIFFTSSFLIFPNCPVPPYCSNCGFKIHNNEIGICVGLAQTRGLIPVSFVKLTLLWWLQWEELGCERIQACRWNPEAEANNVAATCNGVVCPWFRRTSFYYRMVQYICILRCYSVRWIVLNPAFIRQQQRNSNWEIAENINFYCSKKETQSKDS